MMYVLIFISFFYRIYFGLIFFITGLLFLPFFIALVRGENKFNRAFVLKKIWAKSICILVLVIDWNSHSKFQQWLQTELNYVR